MCPNDYLIILLCCIITFLILFPNVLQPPPNGLKEKNIGIDLSWLHPNNWFK